MRVVTPCLYFLLHPTPLQEHASRLQGQLRDAQRQEQSLMEKLSASEAARQQQEMRLEVGESGKGRAVGSAGSSLRGKPT